MKDRVALVIVYSQADNDPRVRSQIDWLHDAGWTVDTLALGPKPAEEVRDHYELGPQPRWVRSRPGSVLIYGLFPARLIFRAVVISRIAPRLLAAMRDGVYSLIVFDDIDLAPLMKDPLVRPRPGTTAPHVHLDIHEYRTEPQVLTAWKRLTRRYRKWLRNVIGDSAFTTRSTVARRIAEMYAQEFGFDEPVVVRSAPTFHELSPGVVNPSEIKMIFHGLASWARGFEQIVEAMHVLDERFTMTFMLTGNPGNIERLRTISRSLGDRVRIVPPVPMTEISATVNQYDLEIMFFPPVNPNVEFALPNKFFEAVQGRLGVVIGESPMMAELVREHEIGAIVDGWTGADLARVLSALTTAEITEFKKKSDAAARVLNAQVEGRVFLSVVDPSEARR